MWAGPGVYKGQEVVAWDVSRYMLQHADSISAHFVRCLLILAVDHLGLGYQEVRWRAPQTEGTESLPRAHAQGVKQSVCPSVVVIIGMKIAISRLLSICACYKHNQSCVCFKLLKKAY